MPRYIDADALIKNIFLMGIGDGMYTINAKAVKFAIDNAPTADVVPKSEVENLIYKLECLLCHATGGKLSKHSYDLKTMETCVNDYINESYEEGYQEAQAKLYFDVERLERICHSYALQYGTVTDQQKVIDKAKAKVAREIFEEIERMCIDTFGNFNHRVFAELKKKYTEEKV